MESNSSSPRLEEPVKPQSRYAPVIERAPLAMVEVEGRNHIVCFVNPAFCALVHQRREEIVGRPFSDLVFNGPECVQVLDRIYETGEPATHVVAEETDAAPALWLYAMWPTMNPLELPERVIIQLTRTTKLRSDAVAMNEALLLGSLRQHELRAAAEKSNASLQAEVIERRRIEGELHAAQSELRMNSEILEQTVVERTAQLQASIGELEAFAYSLAHDLRAPLRAIHGFTEIVLDMPAHDVGPPAVQLLNRVIKAATRMDSLIQDVLNLSQVIHRPMVLASVDIDALVHSIVQERPEFSPSNAEITIVGSLQPVLAHEATLSQCVTNLLSNAVKFVEHGAVPRIRVWTEPVAPPSLSAGRRLVRLCVEDQGIGIPAEARERIFEIFQRLNTSTKFEGSGIGLAIVRKGIERMGGRVGVETGAPKGTRFWLELPAV